MNLTETEIERKAKKYAENLITQAVKNEPEITETLQKIALEVSAEMVGLEHKFKTEESLTQKFIFQARKVFEYEIKQNVSEKMAIEETFAELAERQNDVLRYTFVLSLEKYVFGFRNTLEKLRQQNYVIHKELIWNAWKNIGTSFDKGYRGINSTVISSHSQIFELQFHTAESFHLKSQTHKLYKELRKRETSRQRKIEIAKIMIGLAKDIIVPQGVKKL